MNQLPGIAAMGLAFSALFLILLLGIVGAFVVIVIANRADPDPSGRRPFVAYLFGASFVTVWTALIGSVAVVSSLVQLIGRTTVDSPGALHPVGDSVARGAVLGGLILLVSLLTMAFHFGKGRALVAEEDSPTAPSLRVERSYGAVVCFVSVLVMVVTLIAGVYLIIQLIAPGVFGGSGRTPTTRSLIVVGWIYLAAGLILATHMNLAAPRLGAWRRRSVLVEDTVIVAEPPVDGSI
jgi:hypothetical protein